MGAQMGGACLCQPEADPTAVEVRLLPPGAAVTLLSQQLAGKPANSAEQGGEEPAALQFARRASQVDCSKPRLLLVSDNLSRHELLLSAAKESTVAVTVKYATWGVGELRAAIVERAGEPKRQFQTVGILDHGGPGEFCLLESLCGGTLDEQKVQQSEEAQLFLRFLAGFVHAPDDPAKFRECLDARIDLMNCSVYAGKGRDFVAYLEDLTQMNWAASNNKTGFGSDWIMESDEGLGDVAACYFRESELMQWKFTAGTEEKPAGRGNAMSFTDGVCGARGQYCVVSFPGKLEKQWNLMTGMVTLSKALVEKGLKKEGDEALFSTACVFLPEGDKRFGRHWTLDEEGGKEREVGPEHSGPCYCSKLYHEKKPWGCYWFEEWREQVEKAVELDQQLVVVYKELPKWSLFHRGTKVKWGQLPVFTTEAKDLGGSQMGEVAWLKKQGWSFAKWDPDTHEFYMSNMLPKKFSGADARKLAGAILQNLEVQRSLPELRLKKEIAVEDRATLFDALGQCTALHDLTLDGCGLGAKDMKQLGRALCTCKKMMYLTLSRNPLGDEGAEELSKILPQLPRMSALIIESAAIGDKGAVSLVKALAGEPAVVIRLPGNPIGKEGKQAIDAMTASNPRLYVYL